MTSQVFSNLPIKAEMTGRLVKILKDFPELKDPDGLRAMLKNYGFLNSELSAYYSEALIAAREQVKEADKNL